MTQYVLINAATYPFVTPNTIVPAISDGPIVSPQIAQRQTFQLTVKGIGVISATVQPVVSNDGVNWANYGDPVTAAGTTKVTVGFGGEQNWKYYSAYLTAISGTATQATLILNG